MHAELVAGAVATDYYARRLATPTEWASIPLTRRAELVRDQLEHPPFGSRRRADAATPVRAGATGTGEELLVLAWSEHDLALERRAGVRCLRRLGVQPATPVANTLPGELITPGSLLLGDVIEEIGALDVPLGATESDAAIKAAWELVDRVEPRVIVLEAATGARFLAGAGAGERPWLEGLVWLLRPGSFAGGLPAAPAFAGWQRYWLALPEAACFAAVSCSAAAFHVDESVHAEIVGGEVVVTPAAGSTALLRYATGVRASWGDGSCSCGHPGRVLQNLECGAAAPL